MLKICFLLLIAVAKDCRSQDEDGPYRGRFIGKLNSYHHQVSGDVYAVDDFTILLENFNYDGTGDDTFFWAGDAGRPGPQGFIVPNEYGRTNILERYYNAEVRLAVPEGKRISRIKWLAVYDIGSQNAFGDVFVPDEFEAPAEQAVGPLAGSPAVSSKPVRFLDATTILIPELRYDGSGEEVYFWTGVGPQPSSRGMKIPDEYGYLEPIRAYAGEDVRLQLPGGSTVFDVKWVALWDRARATSLASVLVPEALNVPPAPVEPHAYESPLPHCKQLHRDFQVSWEVFGNQVTIELAAQMDEDEYMAFGVSGSDSGSRMLGADVAVAQYNPAMQRGLATDYNITANAPCVQVLGAWRGVCRDDRVGGLDSNQVFSARRENGLTVVSYRRTLAAAEPMDRAWVTDRAMWAVWALGRLDHEREPAFHRLYPRADVQLHLASDPPNQDCVRFTVGARSAPPVWEVAELFDPALRVFTFRLGPAGGARGLAGRPLKNSPPLAWYVNGQLAPDLQLRRGLHYSFKGVRRQRPALGHGVPPADRDGGARGRPRAPQRGGAALGAGAGRRALHAARPPRAHGGRPGLRGAPRGPRGPAPRRRLRHVPRLQPLAAVELPGRGAGRAAGVAQQLVARPRVLPLVLARRHGRPHLRRGQAPPQHRAHGRRRACAARARASAGGSGRAARRVARRVLLLLMNEADYGAACYQIERCVPLLFGRSQVAVATRLFWHLGKIETIAANLFCQYNFTNVYYFILVGMNTATCLFQMSLLSRVQQFDS